MSAFAATGGQLFKAISVNGNGDNALGISVANQSARVIAMVLIPTADVTLTIKSDTGGGAAALSGAMPIKAGVPYFWNFNEAGWLQTASGKDLNLFTGAGVALNGNLVYQSIL